MARRMLRGVQIALRWDIELTIPDTSHETMVGMLDAESAMQLDVDTHEELTARMPLRHYEMTVQSDFGGAYGPDMEVVCSNAWQRFEIRSHVVRLDLRRRRLERHVRELAQQSVSDCGSPLAQRQGNSSEGADDDNQQRRCAPDSEESETDKRDPEISRRLNRIRPHRIIERRTEQAHDRSIDTAHHRLRP